MKKLLFVLLILSIAPMAGATLSLRVNGADAGDAITMAPSDTALIGVNQSEVHNFVAYVVLMTQGPGSWTGVSHVYAPPALANVEGWTYYGTDVDPSMDIWGGNFSLPGLAQGGPGVFGDVQFHCDGPGDVTILLLDEDQNEVDALTIHQVIPEPATIALLCLGGLLLRKKK